MADIDYSRLTDSQLMALKAVEGDLSKLSDKDLLGIRDTLQATKTGLVERGLNAVGDAAKAVGNAKRSVDDYVTTQGIRAVGGMASLPGTVAKGAEWGYRQLGIDPASIFGQQGAKVLGTMASDYPTADKISDTVQSAANVRPVNLEGNIPGGKIIDTGVQGGLGALLTGGMSAPAMMAGVGGGVGSESLGQVAQTVAPNSPGIETAARLLGALGGGVGGAVTPSVVRKAGSAATGLRAPFTQAGQDKILGTALRDVAADPDAAVTFTIPITARKSSR